MGISPTIKLGRELKNPKTAIVNIVPIGSLPPEASIDIDNLEIAASTAEESDPEATADLTLETTFDSPALEIPVVSDGEIYLPSVESATPAPLEVAVESVAIDREEAGEVTDAESDEIPENRRRRRRSSATVD
jgi:ribonuclease E